MTSESITGLAASVVDNLRSTPVILGLIVLNIVFIGFVYSALGNVRKAEQEHFGYLLKNCVQFNPQR